MTDMNFHTGVRPDRHRILLTGIISLTMVAIFWEILAWVVKGWFTFDRSYSLLILLLSLYMIWIRRDAVKSLPIQPSILCGALVTSAGCFMAIAGRLSNTLMLQGIALVLVLLGLIWLILGTRHLKMLLVPVGYLLFMFYLIEELLGIFSHHLQLASAWIATQLIAVTGMPVFLGGNLIELPHISLEVARVCNGVNHIVALTALSIPFALLSHSTALTKGLFVVGAFLAGLLANGMRVAMIGFWTKFQPGGPLHGPFDIFYVSFILLFGLVVVLLPMVLSKKWRNSRSGAPLIQQASTDEPQITIKPDTRRLRVAVSLAFTILLITNLYINLHIPMPVELKRDLSEFPMQIGQWEGNEVTDKAFPAKHLTADAELRRIYEHPSGTRMGLYIGYFITQEQGKELVNQRLNWLHHRAEKISISRESNETKILRGIPRGLIGQTYPGDRRVLYFWYQIDDELYVDQHLTKIALFMNNLLNWRSNGALVLISNETSDYSDSLRSDKANGFLAEIMEIMEIIPDYF